MQKLIFVISYILLSHQSLMAQQLFSRTYDLEEDVRVRGREVDLYNDHIYVLTGKVCFNPDRECGDIVKMDLEGNIIWKKEIGAFDIGNTNSVWINNDTITITGHRSVGDQPIAFFMQQMTTEGDSLTNYVFPIDTNQVKNALNYGTSYFDQEWYIYGAGNGHDGSVDAILMKIDGQGELLATKIWDEGLLELQFSELSVVNDSLIYLSEKRSFNSFDRYFYIEHLDKNCESLTLTVDEVETDIGVLDRFTYSDERYFIATEHEFLTLALPVIYILNKTGEQVGYFEFDHQIGIDIQRFISELITVKNGDIIGVGFYTPAEGEKTGWMFRISSEGELLWETTFRSQDWSEQDQLRNNLNDVVELEDGSLIAIGWQDETTDNLSLRDLWVIRVSPDGCLYDDDCGFGQFTTSSYELDANELGTGITPNPASTELYIEVNGKNSASYSFELVDITGRLIAGGANLKSEYKLDISSYSSGLYFCRIIDAHGKLIKVHKVYIQ